jgi:hypothetical protein
MRISLVKAGCPAFVRPRQLFLNFLASLGLCKRVQDEEHKKEKSMNEQNRVLIRRTARELTTEEIELATGGLRTLTACTIDELCCKDGDASIGEC